MDYNSLIISYGDQEHSKLYVRKEGTKECLYLEYEEAKWLYSELAKYVVKEK